MKEKELDPIIQKSIYEIAWKPPRQCERGPKAIVHILPRGCCVAVVAPIPEPGPSDNNTPWYIHGMLGGRGHNSGDALTHARIGQNKQF